MHNEGIWGVSVILGVFSNLFIYSYGIISVLWILLHIYL